MLTRSRRRQTGVSDMGRKEKQVDATAGPVAEFALALRKVRQEAGNPTYRQMATTVHFSAPALSKAASGKKLPTWPVAEAYLRACSVTDLRPWEDDWNLTNALFRVNAKPRKARDSASSPSSVTVRAEQVRGDGVATRKRCLLATLDEIRNSKGMSLRAVAARSLDIQKEAAAAGRKMPSLSTTTIYEVLSGRRRLDDDFIRLFLLAVDASAEQQYQVGLAFGLLERETQSGTSASAGKESRTPTGKLVTAQPVRALRQRQLPQNEGESSRDIGRAAVAQVASQNTPQPQPNTQTHEVEVSGVAPALVPAPADKSAAVGRATVQPWPRRPIADVAASHRDREPLLTLLDDSYVELDWPDRRSKQCVHQSFGPATPSVRIELASRVRRHRTKAGYHGQRRPYLIDWPSAEQRRLLFMLAFTAVLAGLGLCVQALETAPLRAIVAASDFTAYLLIAVGFVLGLCDLALVLALHPFGIRFGWLKTARIGKRIHDAPTVRHPDESSRPRLAWTRGRRRHGSLWTGRIYVARKQPILSRLLGSFWLWPKPITDHYPIVIAHRRPPSARRWLGASIAKTRSFTRIISSNLAQFRAIRPRWRPMISSATGWGRLARAGSVATAILGFTLLSSALLSPTATWTAATNSSQPQSARPAAPECLRLATTALATEDGSAPFDFDAEIARRHLGQSSTGSQEIATTSVFEEQRTAAGEQVCWHAAENTPPAAGLSSVEDTEKALTSHASTSRPSVCRSGDSDGGCANADPSAVHDERNAVKRATKSPRRLDSGGTAPVWPDEVNR